MNEMNFAPFVIYPAIDLMRGQVVRLRQGDPKTPTIYSSDPAAVARRWLSAGVRWLHVVNLDGAFGERDDANQAGLLAILKEASQNKARVQFGGGLRSTESVERMLDLGVERVILGTIAIEESHILAQLISRFGPDRIAAGIDARQGIVQLRGWKESAPIQAVDLAKQLTAERVRWLVFTDVNRDGLGSGINIPACLELAKTSSANVIAAGGVKGPDDLIAARSAGLAGLIVGRALYEGSISIEDCL